MNKISLTIILAILLMVAVPVTAQLPVCESTVLTATNNCVESRVDLEWTAMDGAAAYKLCMDGNQNCFGPWNSLTASINSGPPTLNLRIVPVNGEGSPLCESNQVTATFPVVCDVPAPEFPSMVLPATMIIGFLGAVLCIRRTREK